MVNKGFVKRKDLFVITKVHKLNCDVLKCINEMGLTYVDCVLLHRPNVACLYSKLIELKNLGYIHHVGVSNFNVDQLKNLVSTYHVLPYMNQIELHFRSQKKDIVEYCRHNNILVQAHTIGCSTTVSYDISLRWLLYHLKVNVCIGSVNHIQENLSAPPLSSNELSVLQNHSEWLDGYCKFNKY